MEIGTVSTVGLPLSTTTKFFKDNWIRPVILSDKQFYRWQFLDPPANSGTDNCVVAYDEEKDQLAGILGLNNRDFFMNGSRLDGAELSTWIVGEAYRGTGIAEKMIRYVMDNYDVAIAMGISEAALPIYMRLGFRLLRQIPRFVKVLNFDAIEEHCRYDQLGKMLARGWNTPTINPYYRREVTRENIDRSFDTAIENLNMFSRSHSDIDWRYINHPSFSYSLDYVSSSETAPGVIVALRIVETDYGFKVMHLMDVFGDLNSVDAGRSFVEDYALEHSVDVIDAYCTTSKIFNTFMANHWFSVADDSSFKFPHLFSPLEMRDPPSTSLAYWSKNNLSELLNTMNLYISKQDADFDRPTLG